eukprot:gene13043-17479_t
MSKGHFFIKTGSMLCIIATIVFLGVQFTALFHTPLVTLLINQGLLDILHGELIPLTNQHIHVGKNIMQMSNVSIIGAGRDLSSRLDNILHQVEQLSGHFKYSQAVFVEGNSNDDTLQKLNNWANLSNNNRSIYSVKDLHKTENIKNNELKLPREGRIANARNIALNALKSMPWTEYIIVIDMDIIGWSLNGIMDSFGRTTSPQWDVMCGHGTILHGLYRDTYAFRPAATTGEITTNHHLYGDDHDLYGISDEEASAYQKSVMIAKRDAHTLMDTYIYDRYISMDIKPIKLNSCFGGLAIYRSNVFKECSYNHRYSYAPNQLDCEHAILHKCARDKNYNIYSNYNMKLYSGQTEINMKNMQTLFKNLYKKWIA